MRFSPSSTGWSTRPPQAAGHQQRQKVGSIRASGTCLTGLIDIHFGLNAIFDIRIG